MKFSVKSKLLANIGVAASMVATAAVPVALTSTPAEAQVSGRSTIVVTARKREENLFDIPLAITAYTSDQLVEIGAKNLVELAKFTPGLQFNDQGVQEPGRVYTAIRFRGLGSEIKEPFGQVGSAFLDGIYLTGGLSSLGVENFERVEVVKGPSSAWLGRSTFAGAINLITKTPSLEEYSGRATAKWAEDNTYDVTLAHEGPIIRDKLAYRIFLRGYGTGGQYTASDGGRLGAEQTQTFMGTLYSQLTDDITVKFRSVYSEDDDGAPAQALISGPLGKRGNNTAGHTNCFAQNPTWPSLFVRNNPALGNLSDFVCGQVPEDLSVVDSTTTLGPRFLEFWQSGNFVPETKGVPALDRVGLKRKQRRLALDIGWDLSSAPGFLEGSTIDVLAGYDVEAVAFIRDFDLTPVPNWLSRDPSRNETIQVEGRITSAQDQRFKWQLGLSYFDGKFQGSFQGGETIIGADGGLTTGPGFDLDEVFGGVTDGLCPCFFPPLTAGAVNTGKVLGVFGQLSWDVTEWIGIDFEWRYQRDKVGVQDSGLSATFNTFLPRVTLNVKPTETTNLWATYSKGNTPGFFNGDIVNRNPQDQALILAEIASRGVNTGIFIDEESLINYELGWKQQLMDNRVVFSVVGYYMNWKDQKTRSGERIVRTVTTPGGPPGSEIAANLVIGGFSTEILGVEFEGSAQLTDNLRFDGAVNFSDAEFQNFSCGFTDDFAPADASGNLDCSGNRPVQFPKWTSSFGVTWEDVAFDDIDYFVRVDGTYTGKRFVDEQNFAFIGTQFLLNARVGFHPIENVRIELFVTNILNDKTWNAGNRWSDFSADQGGLFPFEFTAQQGIALSAPQLRQAGFRAAVDF